MATRRPTMQDVARAAGVSSATVSRVFSDHKTGMSAETADRVRRIATELGYTVNTLAASLRVQQTWTVGLILADIANPFFGRLAHGVEDVLSAAGYSVLFGNTKNSIDEEIRLLRVMMEKQVDAVILASVASDDRHLLGALKQGLQVVLVDSELCGAQLDTVVVDNRLASARAVGHLIDLGHRAISIVTGPMVASFDRDRLEGYRDAFQQRGLAIPEDLVLQGDSTYEGGRAVVEQLLNGPGRPTAFFTSNDLMTMGALAALDTAGLRIPQDVSIIGFDDLEWYPIFRPRITAVSQPAMAIGMTAARHLLERLKGFDGEPRRFLLNTDLILRDSTGPAKPILDAAG